MKISKTARRWIKRAVGIAVTIWIFFQLRECKDPLAEMRASLTCGKENREVLRLGGPKKIEEWVYTQKSYDKVEGACYSLFYLTAYSLRPRSGQALDAIVRIYERLAGGWIEELSPAQYGGGQWDESFDGDRASWNELELRLLKTEIAILQKEDYFFRKHRFDPAIKRVEYAYWQFTLRNWEKRKFGTGGSLETHLPKKDNPPSGYEEYTNNLFNAKRP